jgi:hypothetical protein
VDVAVTTGREHIDERGRIADRQRAQQRRIDEREHRRIGADAKPKRQYGDGRKPRAAAEPPKSVAEIGHGQILADLPMDGSAHFIDRPIGLFVGSTY